MLIAPRFLALDTSHLAQWAKAACSRESAARHQARGFWEWLQANDCLPLLCLHHVEELINHADENVAADRLYFLEQLPLVSWIGNVADGDLGSVVTMFGEEMRAALARPHASALEVRADARQRLICLGSGERMLGATPEQWLSLRPFVSARSERARQIVGLTRLNTIDLSETPMAKLMQGGIRSGSELEHRVSIMAKSIASHLAERADSRLQDHQMIAARFMADALSMARDSHASAEDLILRTLAHHDVLPSDIKPESTVGEVLQLVLFRTQLKIVAKASGLDASLSAGLRTAQLPTWLITKTLERCLPDVPKRMGSELNDTHLAALAAYADVTFVDKRTLEGVRRLRLREPLVASLLNRIERAATFTMIPSNLAKLDWAKA